MLNKLLFAMIFAGIICTAYAADMGRSATGECAELCDVDGIKKLVASNGYQAHLFAEQHTSPTLVIEYNGRRCYGDLIAGDGRGINLDVDGAIYHTHAPGYCPTFFFRPETDSKDYAFEISAAGTYTIEWGDGKIETIKKDDVGLQQISHRYTDGANKYEIGLGGRATQYFVGDPTAAIRFFDDWASAPDTKDKNPSALLSMRGCLGCIFPTIDGGGEGKQPRFYKTFSHNLQLSSEIPSELFNGIYGAPVSYMFGSTFYNDGEIRGTIPSGLFGNLSGKYNVGIFSSTFYNCRQLSGSIPPGLFGNLYGAPARAMFNATFMHCRELTGSIPAGLFGNLSGAPAASMFSGTLEDCIGLTGEIPEDLFGDIYGPAASQMFWKTFRGTYGITGPSARVGKPGEREYLYERWPDNEMVWVEDSAYAGGGYYTGPSARCYETMTGLTDWDNIPANWGGPKAMQ